jgi:hypothetical protein
MHNYLAAFLRSKKGVEIAASTMVILIISVLIFGYSIYFLFDMWRGVEEISGQIDVQTKSQIDSLLRDPRSKVAIPLTKKTVFSGGETFFWIGIKNVGDNPATFKIKTEFSGAYSLDGKKSISPEGDPDSWTGNFREVDLEDIPAKQSGETFIIIKPDIQQKGVYVFRVDVTKEGAKYGEPKSISVEVK